MQYQHSRRSHDQHRDQHHQHMAHHQSAASAVGGPHHTNHSVRPKDYVKHQNSGSDSDVELQEMSGFARFCFGLMWCFAQVGMWGAVLLLLYWMLKFDKGFAWQHDRRKMFNLHAFLMLTGFIFMNGQAMLIYKTFLCCKKIYNKITHTIFFLLSISLITFGLIVGIQAQHMGQLDLPTQHFYSIHSWIGLATVGLFALQFLFGFVSFLVLLCCERATAGYRATVLPTHQTMGITIYMLAIAGCLTGLLQTALNRLSGPAPLEPEKHDYKSIMNPMNPFLNPSMVINMVGACLIALAIIMPYIIRNFTQRRNVASFSVN
ncbi:uncharacterized protein LOC128963762 isoform X2 [Oppia nitens]|uniref:uncharacterized protein LOC128963762 isoform X2 n=1 Tax=Oppia nitens TaxID=1686743 RepID=UPI0023DC658D|nr:uncharacterized protein LOC128963762 isoform X2 [Oppia nitens]